MKIPFVAAIFLLLTNLLVAQTYTISFEKSNGKQSSTYREAIQFYKSLDKSYASISIKTFGKTDAGYPLHVVFYSADSNFSRDQWARKNKIIVLINNGIHPGEPDGIDASMMLLRDVAIGKIKIPANVVLAVIPVYNIGGALNRNSHSRVNQNGPEQYGFRGNAQNLDLNRDFTKMDSKNAAAFAEVFHFLKPHILIDNHVSDGADHQHTMTLISTQHDKLGGDLGKFLHETFDPAIYKEMENKNWPMVPYVNFEEANPDNGWAAFYDPPRYSSGYAALFQTIAYVPETHMLKPFAERVKATYALMHTISVHAGKYAQEIIEAKKLTALSGIQQNQFPLSWKIDSMKHDKINFKGYGVGYKKSGVTGMQRLFYDHSKPFDKEVNFYNYFKPDKTVEAPLAYIIPQGWHKAIKRLQNNKVRMSRLSSDSTIEVEVYKISDYKSSPRPYESHHKNYDVQVEKEIKKINFLKGDYLIYTNQNAKRYIIEMLEPEGDDSFFAWNFFDAILQQKEGYSDYRWEDVAAAYLETHPEIRQQLEQKKKADEKFAASSQAQLYFVYTHSPYYEPSHNRYPVYRVLK